MAKVFVLGSLNMDTTYYVNELPDEGETIMSVSGESAVGGKGFNQAVAAAWTGADTGIIGAVGDDGSGAQMRVALQNLQIDLTYLKNSKYPSGSAVILVDSHGKNLIVVNGGANRDVVKEDIPFSKNDWLMAQLETPVDTVMYYFSQARKKGTKTVLNLSPFQRTPKELLQMVDLLIVNEHEASGVLDCMIQTVQDACRSVAALEKKGVHSAVITLGEAGAVAICEGQTRVFDGISVHAADTQGAGDAFAGVLVGNCCKGKDLWQSTAIANQVAAQCVAVAGSTLISLNAISSSKEGIGIE